MAALNFPDSPTIGDVFTTGTSSYTWNGTAWLSSSIATIAISDVTGLQTALNANTTAIANVAIALNNDISLQIIGAY